VREFTAGLTLRILSDRERHSPGAISDDAVFQSFDTLFDLLLILDPVRNPHLVLDAPRLRIVIGFIPYGHTFPFEGRGALTVLAFPRLFLMLALFVVRIGAVLLVRSSEERAGRGRTVLASEASR
jgi:hypothetical protein